MDIELLAEIELPIQLQVLSLTPGRVRVRLEESWRDPAVMDNIVQGLAQFVPALERAKTNPTIGSLTLYFDPSQESGESLFERLAAMGVIALAAPTMAQASASQRLTRLTTGWNQRVNQWTEGTADLRFLVPMALAILALRRFLLKGNGLKSAPWYILAWYAFDSFVKLNSDSASSSAPELSLSSANPAESPPQSEASALATADHNGQVVKARAKKVSGFE